jgi:flavin reductase (DIM6/NTAB) family NADH-FMN oxidoreductase RutF/rubredoxin
MDKKALFSLSYGLYIVCGKKGQSINGQVANTAFQISADPITIAVSINKNNLTHEYIMSDQVFTVSVLAADAPLELIGNFGFKSGREVDKFNAVNYKLSAHGVPYILENTLSYMEAEVLQTVDAGTHTIFIGKVTNAEVFKQDNPMTYALYHQIKSGGAKPSLPPKTVTSTNTEKSTVEEYKCTVCGYVYNPDVGDVENGVEAGTPFDQLPDTWTCPICGVGKEQFEKI